MDWRWVGLVVVGVRSAIGPLALLEGGGHLDKESLLRGSQRDNTVGSVVEEGLKRQLREATDGGEQGKQKNGKPALHVKSPKINFEMCGKVAVVARRQLAALPHAPPPVTSHWP